MPSSVESWKTVAGRSAVLEALAETGHQAQRDEFAAALVDVVGQAVLQIRGAVLVGIGDLRAEQQDDPGKINADHEHRHQAEAAVKSEVG